MITPNPFGTDNEGKWLPDNLLRVSASYQLAMSMGQVKVQGKSYSPIQATYVGGEPYYVWRQQKDANGELLWTDDEHTLPKMDWNTKYRKRGELRYGRPQDILNQYPEHSIPNDHESNADDVPLRPLYLMQRSLVKKDTDLAAYRDDGNIARKRMYKWDYDNGIERKPFNSEFTESREIKRYGVIKEEFQPSEGIEEKTETAFSWVEWQYRQRLDAEKEAGSEYDSDAENDAYVGVELKPFMFPPPASDGRLPTPSVNSLREKYNLPPAANIVFNTGVDVCFSPVSPQSWLLTFDGETAEKNYDWAVSADLDWSESLVNGEEVTCEVKIAKVKLPYFSLYNAPMYIQEMDEDGKGAWEIDMESSNTTFDPSHPDVDGDVVFNPVMKRDEDNNLVPAYYETTFKYIDVFPEDYTVRNEGQPKTYTEVGTPNLVIIREPEDDKDGLYEYVHEYDDSVPDSPFDTVAPQFEITDIDIHDGNPELINPFGVVNDLRDKRLRGLFYKKDTDGILFPTMFEVPALPYGFAVPTGEVNNFYAVAKDADGVEKAPVVKHEMITLNRVPKDNPSHGKRLVLADESCFTHKLEILKMPITR